MIAFLCWCLYSIGDMIWAPASSCYLFIYFWSSLCIWKALLYCITLYMYRIHKYLEGEYKDSNKKCFRNNLMSCFLAEIVVTVFVGLVSNRLVQFYYGLSVYCQSYCCLQIDLLLNNNLFKGTNCFTLKMSQSYFYWNYIILSPFHSGI